jgi:hypothetical protein
MTSFYLYLSCNDSKLLFPKNKANNFTVNLRRNINLDGEWECGLKEIYFRGKTTTNSIIYAVCDSCERSYVSNDYIPLLRRITLPRLSGGYSEAFADTYYKRVTEKELSDITISIRGVDGDLFKGMASRSLLCVLHFKPV